MEKQAETCSVGSDAGGNLAIFGGTHMKELGKAVSGFGIVV